MLKAIIKDEKFLAQKSDVASFADLNTAQDLLDTLAAHSDSCVGMAANMIGVHKNIIVVTVAERNIVMLNPTIIKRSGKYITEEGCLSLAGVRTTVRYKKILVQYQDMQLKFNKETFVGFTAQIIQHEIDHCNGILI